LGKKQTALTRSSLHAQTNSLLTEKVSPFLAAAKEPGKTRLHRYREILRKVRKGPHLFLKKGGDSQAPEKN